MRISSTTPILLLLGLTLIAVLGLYGTLLLRHLTPPDSLFGLASTVIGGLIGFLQHKTDDKKDAEQTP